MYEEALLAAEAAQDRSVRAEKEQRETSDSSSSSCSRPVAQPAPSSSSPPAAAPSVAGLLPRVLEVVGEILDEDLSQSADTPLLVAGLDSMGATELRAKLQEVFGVPVPATIAFDAPTPRAVAEALVEIMRDAAIAGEDRAAPHAAEEEASCALQDGSFAASACPLQEAPVASAGPPALHECVSRMAELLRESGFDVSESADMDVPFNSLGMDSLTAVELSRSVAQAFDLASVPATLAFDCPTLRQLAAWAHEQLVRAAEEERGWEKDGDEIPEPASNPAAQLAPPPKSPLA
ncbi:hypothetical protein H632_c4256p0, partial [Helicosporidium sp. ATCC 50920]